MSVARSHIVGIQERVLPAGRRFLDWWRQALLACLPARWRWVLAPVQPRLLLSVREDQVLVVHERGEQRTVAQRLQWPLAPAALDAALGPSRMRVPHWWVLDHAQVLRRVLKMPQAAAAHLHAMLVHEIDRQTPFSADQVHHAVRVLGEDGGQIVVELIVVPRSVLQRLDEEAPGWLPELSGIDVAADDGGTLGVNLLPPAQRVRRRDPRRLRNQLLLLVTVVVWVLAAQQLLENRRAAVEALGVDVAEQARRARAVALQRQQLQDLVDGAAFFSGQRAARPTNVEVWDALTRRLPDGTYLEKLSIEGTQLQLIGLSNEASSLVQRLEGDPLWRRPSLTGVLQSSDDARKDRFTLSAQLRPRSQDDREAANGRTSSSP